MMATIGYLRSDIMGYQWTEAILGQFGSFWAIYTFMGCTIDGCAMGWSDYQDRG